jgi:hypothetical protein
LPEALSGSPGERFEDAPDVTDSDELFCMGAGIGRVTGASEVPG